MLEEMPSRELTEWLAFMRLEHIDGGVHQRADYRAAQVAYWLIQTASKRSSQRVKLEDLLLQFSNAGDLDETFYDQMTKIATPPRKPPKAVDPNGEPKKTVRRTRVR